MNQAVDNLEIDLDALQNYILDGMEEWKVPGLSIAIVKDGNPVLVKGYGTREVGKDLPVDEHTLFSISATTNSFTASALAMLVGEGKVEWEDKLIDLLPNFKTGSDLVTQNATLLDAMSNRTGLAMEPLSIFPHPELSRDEILAGIKHIEPVSEFRTQWGVNFHMSLAAGEVIPACVGESWDDFIQERLFTPIGMVDSVTGPHLLSGCSNVVVPHDRDANHLVPIPHTQTSNIGPATSIYSSAADMARWLNFQLSEGKVGEKTIIPEEELSFMRSNHMPINMAFPGLSAHFVNQGLGLYISDSRMGYKLYGNGGDIDGMEAYHVFVPELNLGIAIMVNSIIAMPQCLIAWILDRYTGATHKNWLNDILSVAESENGSYFLSLETSRQAASDSSKPATFPISDYAGVYRHALLGDLTVEAIDGALSFTLGTSYTGNLHHANHDTFFIKVTSPRYSKLFFSGPAQFRLDFTGKLSSVFVADREFLKVSAE